MSRPEKGRSLLHLSVHFKLYERVTPSVTAQAAMLCS